MKTLGPADYERHREFLAPIIAGIEFFRRLSPDQIKNLIYFVKFVEFEGGETVFEKGAPGESFYIIHSGRVEAREPALGGKVIRVMGPGDFFGELALLLDQPRSATIFCAEPTRCFTLDRGDLTLLMERDPELAVLIRDTARQRFENRGYAQAPGTVSASAAGAGAPLSPDERGAAARCPRCAAVFEAAPSTTLLGFRKFNCPGCSEKIVYPLVPWVRTIYWIYLAFLGYVMLSRLAAGTVSFPGLLGVAVIFILIRDARIRKALRNSGPVSIALEPAYSRPPGAPERQVYAPVGGFPWKPLLIVFVCVLIVFFGMPALHRPTGKAALEEITRSMQALDFQRAASKLDRYITDNPSDPEGYAARASVRLNTGNISGAEEDVKTAEKLKPGLPLSSVARCGILLARGEFSQAETRCSAAMNLAASDMERSTISHLIGVARAGMLNYRGALASYNEALRLNASNAVALLSRGELRLLIGPVSDGRDDIIKAAKLFPALQSRADEALLALPDINARPLLETIISNARTSLAALAKMELAYRRRYGFWALGVDPELAQMTSDPEKFRKDIAAVFKDGKVWIKEDGEGLVISARSGGAKPYPVSARGDENGFILPDLEWDGGDFEEETVDGGPGTSRAAPPEEEETAPRPAAAGKKYFSAGPGFRAGTAGVFSEKERERIWGAQRSLSKTYHALKGGENIAGLSEERVELFAAMRKTPAWMDPEEGVLTQSQLWQAPVAILYEIMVLTSSRAFPKMVGAAWVAELRPQYNDSCSRLGLTLDRLKRASQGQAFNGGGKNLMSSFESAFKDCGRLLKSLDMPGGGGAADARQALTELAGRSGGIAADILAAE